MKYARFPVAFAVVLVSLITVSDSPHKIDLTTSRGSFYSTHILDEEPVAFDQPAEAQEYFLLKRSPDGHTPIPVKRYLDAVEHMNRMPQYSTADRTTLPSIQELQAASIEPAALGAWTSLGPGNIGGRTRALLINPQNPSIMYAAGVAGGVWKSTSSGQAWIALGDLLPNIAVSSLAFDPTNFEVVYAG